VSGFCGNTATETLLRDTITQLTRERAEAVQAARDDVQRAWADSEHVLARVMVGLQVERDEALAELEALKTDGAEGARQLQEARTVRDDLGEQLRQTTTVMKRLHGERDEARDALKAMTAERDMAARIDLTAVIHEMVRERDEALEHCESARFGETLVMRERDEARAECATARADRNEARAERSRAWRERDEVRVERDEALAALLDARAVLELSRAERIHLLERLERVNLDHLEAMAGDPAPLSDHFHCSAAAGCGRAGCPAPMVIARD